MTITPEALAWPLVSIGVAIATIATAFAKFRRVPPIAEEIAKTYATKKELEHEIAEVKAEMNGGFRLVREDISRLQYTLQNETKDIQRAVGKLEGKLEGGFLKTKETK